MLAVIVIMTVAASAATLAVSQRLKGEASFFGGYFAGLCTAGLIAVLYLTLTDFQDENLRKATMVCLAELAPLAPLLGVFAAMITGRKPAGQTAPSRRIAPTRPLTASGGTAS